MRVVLFLVCFKNSTISTKHLHCCILVHMSCFLFLGWDLALYCTYVPRVCCVIPCPMLVRTSFHTVFSWDNNSVFITLHSEHQQFYWWDVSNSVFRHPVAYIVSAYLVSYCLLVRTQQRFHHPTLRTSTVILVGCIEQSTISGKHVHCCILVHVSCFFGVGMLPFIVRTYLVCVASSRVLFC